MAALCVDDFSDIYGDDNVKGPSQTQAGSQVQVKTTKKYQEPPPWASRIGRSALTPQETVSPPALTSQDTTYSSPNKDPGTKTSSGDRDTVMDVQHAEGNDKTHYEGIKILQEHSMNVETRLQAVEETCKSMSIHGAKIKVHDQRTTTANKCIDDISIELAQAVNKSRDFEAKLKERDEAIDRLKKRLSEVEKMMGLEQYQNAWELDDEGKKWLKEQIRETLWEWGG